MNRRRFVWGALSGVGAAVLASAPMRTFAKKRELDRTPSNFGSFENYGTYGCYGSAGAYGTYGAYGTFGGYGSYGVYGTYGCYGPYGGYGFYGYGSYYGYSLQDVALLMNTKAGRAVASDHVVRRISNNYFETMTNSQR